MEFNPGDIIHIQVTKADKKQEAGLKLTRRSDGYYYVKEIKGLFKRRNTPLIVGDKMIQLNGVDMDDYGGGLDEMHQVIKKEIKITLCVERQDPDDEPAEEDVDETALVIRPEDSDVEDEAGVDVQFGGGSDAIVVHDGEAYDEDGPTRVVKKIHPGDMMTLDGIEANPDLNGQYVKVVSKDPEKKGRWLVELTATEKTISVSGKKLVRLQG